MGEERLLVKPGERRRKQRQPGAVRKTLLQRTSVLAVAASILGLLFSLIPYLRPVEFLVSSSPPGAILAVDGEEQGTTPMALRLKRGVHEVELTMDGFEDERRVVRLSKADSLFVELRVIPDRAAATDPGKSGSESLEIEGRLDAVSAELESLKAAILDDPSELVSLPLIKSKLDLLEREIATTQASLERISDTVKWFYATIAAIVVGLLGITVTIFFTKR